MAHACEDAPTPYLCSTYVVVIDAPKCISPRSNLTCNFYLLFDNAKIRMISTTRDPSTDKDYVEIDFDTSDLTSYLQFRPKM